jgi:hypothetical protein
VHQILNPDHIDENIQDILDETSDQLIFGHVDCGKRFGLYRHVLLPSS